MGFKDAERAYAVMSITGTPKVVLAALAHRADDKTHRTIVGQDTLASMTGQGVKTVQRALGVLEASGLITRQARFRKDGPRTSDEITLTLDVTTGQIDRESDSPEVPGDESTTGHIDHKSDSPRPTVNESSTNGQIVPAYKDGHSVGHSVGHSDTPIPPSSVVAIVDRFDEFWAAWPRKVGKPTAQRAWVRASKRADPFRIVEAALGYASNPHRPDAEFIPHPSTWLNRDGWDDELPGPRGNGRPTPTQRAASIAQAGQNLMDQRRGLAPVTTLNPKGISS